MASDLPHAETPNAETVPTQFRLPHHINVVLDTILRGAKKRKTRSKGQSLSEEPQPGGDYLDYGRAFARLGQPFTNIFAIVEQGLRHENRDTDDEDDDTRSGDLQDQRLLDDWGILCQIIPKFRDEIIAIAEQRKLRLSVCSQITYGVENARGDDTGSLKDRIVGYVHEDVKVPLDPPVHPSDPNKSIRGWRHPSFAALLTPIELEATDATRADVISGRIKVTGHQLPRFLYPREYNKDDLDSGLFHGHVMLRVAKHIYRGPSAAFQVAGYKRAGRRPNCEIIQMRKMTPRSLAYVAVQARFALSDVQEWHTIDRDFNYETFFWNLVDLLSSDEGKDILTFYDKHVIGLFGQDSAQPSSSEGPSSIQIIKAQRAEKRARLDPLAGV